MMGSGKILLREMNWLLFFFFFFLFERSKTEFPLN